jgi:glycosyltransferase involved in cell wall biosynthesis
VTVHILARAVEPLHGFGGLERAVRLHAESLAAAGHLVCLHTPPASGTDGRSGDELRITRVISVPWPAKSKRLRSLLFGVEYALWARRCAISLSDVDLGDVVHVHGGAGGFLPRRSSTPVVLNPHGLEEFGPLSPTTFLVRPILRRMVRRTAARASAVIATDLAMRRPVQESLSVPTGKVHVIPNVVPLGQLEDSLPGDSWQVVSVGRLVRNKGYDLLAEALVLLRDVLPDNWSWLHFGSGPEWSVVQSIMRNAGLAERVALIEGAPRSEVARGVGSAALFVQPSRYEGSSLTTLEAMALGTVVAATPVGGIPDKIRDGETGFLAAAVSAKDLSVAIGRAALESRSRAEEIRGAARRLVEGQFSVESAVHKYETLYAALLAEFANGDA